MLADGHGNVVHLGERDCSIQRRHQKLIEESPAPLVDEELRERIGKIAVDAARAVDYRGAGTIEGLLSPEGEYFFLEMNTRVQVEHCVTEAVTGVDIVREQILIAAGEPISFGQDDIRWHGHAIECRINAEDASKNFAPAPGTVAHYREPSGPGVRVDSGVLAGSEISPLYDPMVAKLIVWDADREKATRRMARALSEFEIEGVKTLIPFHKAIMASAQWADAETCRDLIEDKDWLKGLATPAPEPASEDEAEIVARDYVVEVSGKRFSVTVHGEALRPNGSAPAAPAAEGRRRKRERKSGGGGGGGDTLASPMQGNVFKVLVEQGADVEEGALVCIIEAMKMENEITAHKAGKIAELPISEGDAVTAGDTLAVITVSALFDEAVDWLKIPSISAGERDEAALREAAEWAVKRVLDAGGTCELVETPGGAPHVVGELRVGARRRADGDDLRPLRRAGPGRPGATGPRRRSSRRSATGACTPAARPTTRATSFRCCTSRASMARAGELPVHVRVLIEGAEETGSDDVGEWVRADERGADAVIVFDSGMVDADTPALDPGHARHGLRARRDPHRRRSPRTRACTAAPR